jgi:predicted sulfurtransferase
MKRLSSSTISGQNKSKKVKTSSSSSSSTRSLGSWFPTATTRKVPLLKPDQKCTILLFYHYVRPSEMSIRRTEELKTFLDRLTNNLQIGGRIRYAQEGLNCTLSGTKENIRTFSSKLSGSKPSGFGSEFADVDYKFIDNLPHDRSFKDLRLIPVKELVFYGVGESSAPLAKGGIHLRPKEYHKKMQEKDTVIVDVRNSYEAEIGKFIGQEEEGGAEYIDPKMRKSTDFKNWLDKPETQEKLKGKQVLLYCTGGVRCERASALVNHKIGEEIKGVYQLHGGVEKYMQEFKETGGYWRGLNYVFDKREGVGSKNIAGVGGVVSKKTKKLRKENKNGMDTDNDSEILGRCCVCNVKWERYVGKKKCYTCGKLFKIVFVFKNIFIGINFSFCLLRSACIDV